MNEKIKQLAEQAEIDYDLRPEIARAPVWIGTDEELEKFAELIVRECAKVTKRTILSRFGIDPDTFTGTVTTVQELNKHFGVEL
jgi:hypothetical protein